MADLKTQLEEALRKQEVAEMQLRTFINITNEIRTPLTLINTSLLTLLREDNEPHHRMAYDTMRRNAERILLQINQMLDVRRLELGKLTLHMCETDLIGFMEGIQALFAQQSKAKMIILDFRHEMQLLPLWIDRVQLDKAIVNILSNAFKFTPVGGFITLRVERDEKNAYIYVRDSGIGIPEEKLPYVFDSFFSAHQNEEERFLGTGVGLDVTRMVIEQQHGSIEVHNNTDGPGCEFKITLPLGNSHLSEEEMLLEKDDVAHSNTVLDVDAAELPFEREMVQRQRQRIVIVEGTDDVRDFLVSELKDDYEVMPFANGREALAAIGRTLPDLVVADIDNSELDGYELCSHVKTSSVTCHIPVILLCAIRKEEYYLAGLEVDADAFIPRPFNMDILRRIIVNQLHRHQMLKLKYGRNEQLESMLDTVEEVESPDDKLLKRLMKTVKHHLDNADLSVDMLASEVGLSRVHLNRKMKELTGQTPHDFIRSLRLKQAAKQLAAGGRNVSDVTYSCGFSNAASFSTLFKKTFGVSPRDYMIGKGGEK